MNIICGEPPIINGEEYPACNSVENVILFIFDFSIIFLIGAIIGLVYEKIKNKKKKIKKVRKR